MSSSAADVLGLMWLLRTCQSRRRGIEPAKGEEAVACGVWMESSQEWERTPEGGGGTVSCRWWGCVRAIKNKRSTSTKQGGDWVRAHRVHP